MITGLISIIVPVYKVELYLENCVKSIQNQTYKNLEIILVDDGSPDKCGQICDNLAKEDPRITVIHKENGGLSSARNEGLAIAQGEYFGFVDSDDSIHPQMYELLLRDIKTYNTKLAFCQSYISYNGIVRYDLPTKDTMVIPKEKLIEKCLRDVKWFSAWSKLYHCSLKEYVHFPLGRTNEDYAIMLMVYDKCNIIAVNYNNLYIYCKREGSITTAPKLRNLYDAVLSAREEYSFVTQNYPESAKYAFRILVANIYTFVFHGLASVDDCLVQECLHYRQYLKDNRWCILKLSVMPLGQRILILSLSLNVQIHSFLYQIYKAVKIPNNI